MKIKMVTIVGARPQFIKAAPVSSLIREKFKNQIREILVHTGQHYDHNMSEIFFRQMRIPRPQYNLGIGGGDHGTMTGRMLAKIEKVLHKEKPNVVLVYGDTNSTLAGALAAAKLQIPIAHVEAGLRSFNMKMPEEINRIITDRISTLLFCPTKTAERNLKREGITRGVHLVGDVMFDAAKLYHPIARKISLKKWKLKKKKYVLCTVHRQENTNNPQNLKAILNALRKISLKTKVIFTVHPRTKKIIEKSPILKTACGYKKTNKKFFQPEKLKGSSTASKISFHKPLGYLEGQRLLMGARIVLSDSGGLQKEAAFHHVPCVTLREETEWIETVKSGLNKLAGADENKIFKTYCSLNQKTKFRKILVKPTNASKNIVKIILNEKW